MSSDMEVGEFLVLDQCTLYRKGFERVQTTVWIVTAIYWEPMDLGESDCLIKTKHREGPRRVLTRCDFCPVL